MKEKNIFKRVSLIAAIVAVVVFLASLLFKWNFLANLSGYLLILDGLSYLLFRGKKNNIFKVVCFVILAVVLLTWFIPTTYYSSGVVDGGKMQIGLFDLFGYLTAVLSYFGYVPLYILAVGGFYGVLYQTSGYRNLLDKIVKKYKGNEWIFLTLVMIIFAVITSFSGLSLGLLVLFPFVITVILLMGYSKITSLLATVGSVCVGLLGTTYSVVDTAIVNSYLQLSPADGIVTKIIVLLVALVLLVVNTLLYARKHKKDEPRKGFLYPETTKKTAKSWPIVVVFDLVLLIMILSFVSWTDVFEITVFEEALTSIKEFKIGEFDIFAKLLGNVNAFGLWQITDLITLLVLATGFVALLYKVKLDDVIHGYGAGAKKALKPAFIVSLLYVLIFISAYNPLTLTVTKPIFELTKGFNVVTHSLAALVSHLFNVEFYYSASNLLGYITATFTDVSVYPIIGLIWQATYGLAMLFVPTSVILVASLSYLNVSYFRWLKAIWKFLLQLIIVLLATFLILTLI